MSYSLAFMFFRAVLTPATKYWKKEIFNLEFFLQIWEAHHFLLIATLTFKNAFPSTSFLSVLLPLLIEYLVGTDIFTMSKCQKRVRFSLLKFWWFLCLEEARKDKVLSQDRWERIQILCSILILDIILVKLQESSFICGFWSLSFILEIFEFNGTWLERRDDKMIKRNSEEIKLCSREFYLCLRVKLSPKHFCIIFV